MTWTQLVGLEPRLGQLLLDCRFADRGNPDGFDAELAWDGSPDVPGMKERLENLVGGGANSEDPTIRSHQAYDLASAECRQALPPNRSGIGGSES
ncbi:MAG: hypothetical protein M1281_16055 [Chloroflexi bacterium]|nr:hypothetical protein [Chloroflexota bacterium]